MIMAAGGSATALLLVCAHRPPPVVLRAAKRNATVHGAGTAASLCNELSKVLKGKVSFKSTPFVIISRSLHSPLYVGISLLPHWALLCYVMLIRTTITCNKWDCPLTSVYPEQKSDFVLSHVFHWLLIPLPVSAQRLWPNTALICAPHESTFTNFLNIYGRK